MLFQQGPPKMFKGWGEISLRNGGGVGVEEGIRRVNGNGKKYNKNKFKKTEMMKKSIHHSENNFNMNVKMKIAWICPKNYTRNYQYHWNPEWEVGP